MYGEGQTFGDLRRMKTKNRNQGEVCIERKDRFLVIFGGRKRESKGGLKQKQKQKAERRRCMKVIYPEAVGALVVDLWASPSVARAVIIEYWPPAPAQLSC